MRVHRYMLLAPGQEGSKPTWDSYNPEQVTKKVNLKAYQQAQAQQESTYFDISPNAAGATGGNNGAYFDIAPTDV